MSSTSRTSLASGLTGDELERLEGQLNHILDQYAILATLDTEHIPPTAQTIELENILRDDVVAPVAAGRRRSSPTLPTMTARRSSCPRSWAASDGRVA